MASEAIGYERLIQTYQLPARPLMRVALIDSSVSGRQTTTSGDFEFMRFESKYRPPHTLVGDLQFAFRYEGINLEVLDLLFAIAGQTELDTWLAAKPESQFARRAGYLYEWLTVNQLAAAAPPKAAYIPVLDEKLQFGFSGGVRNAKFRVTDNLPGNRQFCPLARKTDYLQAMARKDLKQRTQETLARYDRDLLRRAAAFLYLKETHSSFEVEREKPSADRARRFADLLREAEGDTALSENRFAQLQNAVVDARFHEFSYRREQNWIGQDLGHRKKVDFVPARPEDISGLMNGLVQFSEALRAKPDGMDPVVAAASLAFGFVFIHPFMDGNGRLHRYLIHEVLSSSGLTPKGIVLPVSAVILANLDRYVHALERFSKPMQVRTTYNPDVPHAPAIGNDARYFRYFDLTEQASFLYWALERTVEHDLEQEIAFLLGFDAARSRLGGVLDWPAHSLDLFIRLVHQNGGALSRTKYQSHFGWMTDDEVKRCEAVVVEAFRDGIKRNGAH
ncbi:MAG: Fic family protein [Gammaproteobacteria bacterium]|nr:Fic family protein [Gammaproteobacteria bacterium]